jgi:hypothetical protein
MLTMAIMIGLCLEEPLSLSIGRNDVCRFPSMVF